MAALKFDVSNLTDEQLEVAQKIIAEAERQGVNPDVVLPMAFIESKFNQKAVSPKKAIGVMQLLEGTAKDMGVDPYDLDDNIRGGVKYIKQLMESKTVDHDPARLIAAYHDGPNSEFFKTGDVSKISDDAINYVEQFNTLTGGMVASDQAETMADTEGDVWSGPSIEAPEPEAGAAGAEPKYGFSPEVMAPAALVGAPAGAAYGATRKGFSMLRSGANTAADMAEAVRRAADSMADVGAPKGGALPRAGGLPEPLGPVARTPTGGTGTFNYAKKFGLTDFDAARAANMSKAPGGAWDVARQVAEAEAKIGPGWSMTPERADLLLPDQIGSGPRNAPRAPIPPVAPPAAPKPPGVLTRMGRGVANIVEKHPIAMGALSGASAGAQGAEAVERYRTGDRPGAAVSGVGALGSLMTMVPRTSPIGLAMSVASPAALSIMDYIRNRQENPFTPIELSSNIMKELKSMEEGMKANISARKQQSGQPQGEGFQIPVMAP